MSACYTCGGDIGEHLGQCPEGAQALPSVMRDEDLRPFGYRDTWPSSGAQAPVLVLVCEEVTEELRLF